MKKSLKICAAALSASMLCSALTFPTAFAAEEEEEAVTMSAVVTLSGDKATAEGDNVTIDGTKITVTASGAYSFKGTLDNGQICVNVPDETVDSGTVKLFFDGVTITGANDAAVYVVNAEKTSINLVEGTENFLYDGETYNETEAVIYAKDDITIKGDGALRVEAAYQFGIHCNNDLKITGGKIKVKAESSDGIRGKSSVEIKDGDIDVNAEGDGIKSTKGEVLISGGKIEVKAGNDAVQGETGIEISGGSLLANGDRGLRCDEANIAVYNSTVFATATDYQAANLVMDEVGIFMSFVEEYPKDRVFMLFEDGVKEPIFEMSPDKKFAFAFIATPELTTQGKTYSLSVDGTPVEKMQKVVLTGLTTEFSDISLPAVSTDELRFDVNCDDKETVSDAIMTARIANEDITVSLPEAGKKRADANGDGIVNSADTGAILRHIAKFDV